jgi:hypothetical protein
MNDENTPNNADDTQELSTEELEAAAGGGVTPSLSDASQMDYLQLQTAQATNSQQQQALSNIAKKMSDTGESIIQNIKL